MVTSVLNEKRTAWSGRLRSPSAVWLPVLGVAIGLMLGFLATAVASKEYRATIGVILTLDEPQLYADDTPPQLATAIGHLAKSAPVLNAVIKVQHLSLTTSDLAQRVSVTYHSDAVRFLSLNVTDGSPTEAARLADSLATAVRDLAPPNYARRYSEPTSHVVPIPLNITALSAATVPTMPIDQSWARNLCFGALSGLAAAFAISFAHHRTKSRTPPSDPNTRAA